MFPKLWWFGVNIDVLFRPEHSVSYSQPTSFHQLHIFLLTTAHWRMECLWPRLRGAQIYGYKCKYGEGSLAAWPFRITTLTRASVLPSCGALIRITASLKCPAVEQASVRNQLGTLWQLYHYCARGHLFSDRLILWHSGSSAGVDHRCFFFPSTVFVVSSGAMKAGKQGSYPPGLRDWFPMSSSQNVFSWLLLVVAIPQGKNLFLNWEFPCARCMKSKMLMANPRNWCF